MDEATEGEPHDEIEASLTDGDGPGLALKFAGDKFDGGFLPVSALKSLANLEALVKAVTRDVYFERTDGRKRNSKFGNVELALTGEIEDGSAKVVVRLIAVFLATAAATRAEQVSVFEEVTRRVPAVTADLAAGRAPSYPTPPATVAKYRDVAMSLRSNESLSVSSMSDPSALLDGVADNEPAIEGTFTPAMGEQLRVELGVNELRSFFLTGEFRELLDRGGDEDAGQMSLWTPTGGVIAMPATRAQRQKAAREYGQTGSVAFAASGQGEFDDAGRLKRVTHLSELTRVDRTFDLSGRLEELRGLADDPEDAILAARIGRAKTALPTVVHETGRAPFIFMTDDDEIEARWIIGDRVVHVTFGGEIDAYVFDRSSERIVEDLVLDDEGSTEILPGFEIAGLMNRWSGDDAGNAPQ